MFLTQEELRDLTRLKRPTAQVAWLRANGRPLTYTILRRHFKAAAKLAGCEDVTIHDIRRKRITDLTDSHGKDAAQRLAVHSDARTTAGYYAGRKVVEV